MAVILNAEEAVARIQDGAVIHVGGFYSLGTPEDIINELIIQEKKDLTLICNDGGSPHEGIGKLIYAGRVKKLVCSWCGLAPVVSELVDRDEMELELNPQGTLAERIRAAGYGLGGIITPTGLGTIVEEKGWGKRESFNDREWLFHTPLHADVAIVEAYQADRYGNLIFRRTQNNFCEVMCMAADLVIASVVNPIDMYGGFDPDSIMVPGPMVDILVQQKGA